MKKFSMILAAALALVLAFGLFAACDQGGEEEPVYYTVTYDANGGTLTGEESEQVEAGESVTLPTAVKESATLTGWYAGDTLAGQAGDRYTPTASVTLQARWQDEAEEPDPAAEYAETNLARSIEYAKLIRETYWNSDTCLSKLTPGGGAPFLWPYTEQVSMVNGILQAIDETHADYEYFTEYLEELITGLRHYRVSQVNMGSGQSWENPDHVLAKFGENDGTANSYAIYNSGRNDGAIDSVNTGIGGIYFDDNIWVAKEFYYAYLNTGKVEYLNEAVNIVNWIVGEGYEETGLHGIYWLWSAKFLFEGSTSLNDTTHASLNACSSAPTAMMLMKLIGVMDDPALEGKFDGLLDDWMLKAQNIYEFCYMTLRNPNSGCIRDKVFLKEGFEEMTNANDMIQLTDAQELPYNTGTFMTAGAELYAYYAASDEADSDLYAELYQERNAETAAAADRQFANTQVMQGQYSYNSNSWFTSFLLEGFIDLSASVTDSAEYIEHMRSALDYAWNNNRAEDGLVAPAWIIGWSEHPDTGVNSEGNGRQILLQSANAHCYAMLARYYAGVAAA